MAVGWKYGELILGLCQDEKGKSQIKVGDMREAIGRLADQIQKDPNIIGTLLKLGEQRKLKKKK